ncbi:Histone domain containing protein [Trichuris trichiura]|uniref:Histone domain containing protein n=1 Tax=Trichuris trichiura TaxID=36087 RepID=A0A077ZJE6_TRITR|nr:Histone domain containing protein [Trichuris trichiura]
MTELNRLTNLETKRQKNCQEESFKSYIYKVLKKLHPDVEIGCFAMSIMNSFANGSLHGIAMEASRLARYNNSDMIGAREIQIPVRLCFPEN